MTQIEIENGEAGFVVRCDNKEYYITSPDKMVHKVRELFGVTRDHGLKGSSKPANYDLGPMLLPGSKDDILERFHNGSLRVPLCLQKTEPIVEQVDEIIKHSIPLGAPFPGDDVCSEEHLATIPKQQAVEDTLNTSPVPSTDSVLPSSLYRFEEGERVSKAKLASYVSIPRSNMGYHDQGDGVVVLCNNNTKVYTTWEDLFKLPASNHIPAIMELNYPKRGAIIAFRKWMSNNLDQLPAGVDPDADFRPLLSKSQDTRIAQDGSKLEGTLDGD